MIVPPTFNQTMIKFQNPIILKSKGVSPCHAFVSLIATTYMKWRMNSMVRRDAASRMPYLPTVDQGMVEGRRCW